MKTCGQPDAGALLWDARRAAGLIERFVAGYLQDHQDDPMLRSAVERRFEIIGEALNRLSTDRPRTRHRDPDLPRIVAFRNVFIHGCATINVWELATARLDVVVRRLAALLDRPT